MDLFLTILGAILLFLGFLGTFVPVLPGAPLSWAGLMIAYFSDYSKTTVPALIISGIIAVVVSILDNFLPILMTKKIGGSKKGTWGSTIGLIIGMFLGPLGILLGAFCGALVGELIENSSDEKRAFKAAWGSFLGFLLGTGIKMISSGICIWLYVKAIFKFFAK
jgi:uncharacterized protein YqgC (DUF456 family)